MAKENTAQPLRDKDGKIMPGGFVFEILERDKELEKKQMKIVIEKLLEDQTPTVKQ